MKKSSGGDMQLWNTCLYAWYPRLNIQDLKKKFKKKEKKNKHHVIQLNHPECMFKEVRAVCQRDTCMSV